MVPNHRKRLMCSCAGHLAPVDEQSTRAEGGQRTDLLHSLRQGDIAQGTTEAKDGEQQRGFHGSPMVFQVRTGRLTDQDTQQMPRPISNTPAQRAGVTASCKT
jgi:hypothetical protein